MATTVNVLIKGVAICYEKDNLWKVLFPFDGCHSVKVSYKVDGREVFLGHFGQVNNRLSISTDQQQIPPQSSNQFKQEVLDLTDPSGKTHPTVMKKQGWNDRGVLLTIKNINFDVRHKLKRDFPNSVRNLDLILTDRVTERRFGAAEDVAHSVEGNINLKGNETVTITTAAGTNIFTSEPGNAYEITFDNDCELPNPSGKNDMEMFYELIEEPGKPNRKFIIEGKRTGDPVPGPKAIPPSLLEGKPCLAVQVTKSEQLP